MAVFENFPYKEPLATNSRDGLMSKSDKAKLDSIDINNIGTSKIEVINYTAKANSFTDSKMIILADILENDQIIIGLDNNLVTSDQYNAAALAKFITKTTSEGIELTCLGTVPTIDIPICIYIIKK